jgi:hypothetical protein
MLTPRSIPGAVVSPRILRHAPSCYILVTRRAADAGDSGAFSSTFLRLSALEYEEVLQRQRNALGLSEEEVSSFIDSLCALAHHHEIYFQWHPFLTDVDDELILELAVSANCEYIVTFNVNDFRGSKRVVADYS